jgi:hypothetical protein
MRKWIFLGLLSLSLVGAAKADHVQKLCSGFLPPNSLNIPVGASFMGSPTGITEAQFNSILDRIQSLYGDEIKQKFGAKFVINRNWTDGTVNAYATQSGSEWAISMFGGLARYKGMTEDGFAAVACHETGHHLGGAPKYADSDWAAVEGGADYYAMLKCLRRYFEHDDNEAILAARSLDQLGVSTCNSQFADHQAALICIRGTEAGIVLGSVLQDLGGESSISLGTPDSSVVTEVYEGHPHAQCRLDTYFNGALCPVAYSEEMSSTDYRQGSCHNAKVTPRGLRPLCWFKP